MSNIIAFCEVITVDEFGKPRLDKFPSKITLFSETSEDSDNIRFSGETNKNKIHKFALHESLNVMGTVYISINTGDTVKKVELTEFILNHKDFKKKHIIDGENGSYHIRGFSRYIKSPNRNNLDLKLITGIRKGSVFLKEIEFHISKKKYNEWLNNVRIIMNTYISDLIVV